MSAAGTEVATIDNSKKQLEKSPINTFRLLIEQMKPQLAIALPKHIDVNRMVRVCLTTIQKTPKLLDCTRESLLGCLVQCAQLGLEPDGMLGHAYLIPYGTTCTLIVGYKGMLKLARQSGEILSVSARVVHAKDEFAFDYGLNERLVHVPADEEDPGALTHVYCIIRYKDGGHNFDVMTKREVDAIRKRSRAGNNGPWVTDYEAMALKTVIRRGLKLSPASIEDKMARAISLDERAEADVAQELDTGGIVMPPEDVPGSAPEQQGQRISLKPTKPKVTDPEQWTAQPSAADAIAAATKAAPDTGYVADAQTQVASLAADKGLGGEEIAQWFSKNAINELSKTECAAALVRLAQYKDV